MIFRSRPRRVICVVAFLLHLTQKTSHCSRWVLKTIPGIHEGTPITTKERPSALLGIENDTHHSKEGTPPSTHPQVSKTIPGRRNVRSLMRIGSLMNLQCISLNSLNSLNSLILQKKLQKTLVSRLSSLVFLLSLWRI